MSRVRETCGHLRKLSVNCTEAEESYGLSEALSLLLKKNIYLSVMSVRNVSSVDDSVLLNISKFLTELDLGGCCGVSDAGWWEKEEMISEVILYICQEYLVSWRDVPL